MYGLSMRATLVQLQICSFCGGSAEHHRPGCPEAALAQLSAQACADAAVCPVCAGEVQLNAADFYECRACSRQYARTASTVGDTLAEPLVTGPRHIMLLGPAMTALTVIELPARGLGRFRIDARLAVARRRLGDAKRTKAYKRRASGDYDETEL